MRNWVLVLLAGFGLTMSTAWAADGATLYQQYCAVCHGENGEGVPGKYPALNGPVGRLATVPEGREFLIATILFGLEGEIMQRGIVYNEPMPGEAAALSDEDVATLLNWLKVQWNNARFGAQAPEFTPEEVAKVRALNLTPQGVYELLMKVEAIMHQNRPGPGGGGMGRGAGHGHQGQGQGQGQHNCP